MGIALTMPQTSVSVMEDDSVSLILMAYMGLDEGNAISPLIDYGTD